MNALIDDSMSTLQAPPENARLGILMLETQFSRPVGDVGNPESFPFPVIRRVIAGAVPGEIVGPAAGALAHLPGFVAAARELEADGVSAITTSCGFLVLAQAELAAAVRVPVVTSALLIAPLVRAMTGGMVGIVTAHSGHLSPEHLAAAGIDPAWAVIRGMEDCPAFAAGILGNAPDLDMDGVSAGLVSVCLEMQAKTPALRAIVLECTNLPPYAGAVRRATGLPVWGILDAVALMMAGYSTTR